MLEHGFIQPSKKSQRDAPILYRHKEVVAFSSMLESVHMKTWYRHQSWQWKHEFLLSKSVTKFDKQNKTPVTTE